MRIVNEIFLLFPDRNEHISNNEVAIDQKVPLHDIHSLFAPSILSTESVTAAIFLDKYIFLPLQICSEFPAFCSLVTDIRNVK